eukprot:867168-Pyramimonas_sp.AAC.1
MPLAGGARRIDPRQPLFDPSGIIHRLPVFSAADRFRLPDYTDRSSFKFTVGESPNSDNG